jgi:hypothetical protein
VIPHITNFWKAPISTAFGVIIGVCVVLLAPNVLGPVLAAWDQAFPVVEPVDAELVDRHGDEVILSITAKKNKGEECTLIRIYGYGIDAAGVYSLATVRRPDGSPFMGIVHGEGTHDFGLWRIKPTDADTVRVQVYVEHNCLGRVIKSKMADVKL